MPSLYVIPNWDRDFENARSKQVGKASFFCVQNHFDGKKIRRLQGLKKPAELYGSFHAIAAIASKCQYRGVLLDHDGPISAQDLAAKTGFPAECFTYALDQLSKPAVGLLEKHEIEFENGEWVLPEAVRTWAVLGVSRRRSASPRVTAQHSAASADLACTPVYTQKPDPNNGTSLGGGSSHVHAKPSAGPTVTECTSDDTHVHETPRKAIEQNRTEQKGMPPAVPQGGQSNRRLILNPEIAKRLICEKILGGKNPERPWSYPAQEGLARLCGSGGLPFEEIEKIGAYRAIPKSDDIPELKARRDPITETSLIEYWGDELQRAHAYLEKYRPGKNGVSQKKEPADWREFFRWKYGPECTLPPSFWKLDEDQQREWDREHEEFGRKNPALPLA